MNFYSLLLLALTLASSFCVVARSPFLTACRRSCSFPMISTSQNSTSVPQESCSSLTPPYSGATAAWTYPRILSFGSAWFSQGRWQPDVWANHKQLDIRISPTITSSNSTACLLQRSVWFWMWKAGEMENLFCLMNCLPVFRSQVSRAFSELVWVAWSSDSGNAGALLMLWFRRLRRLEFWTVWISRPKPEKGVGKKNSTVNTPAKYSAWAKQQEGESIAENRSLLWCSDSKP